MVSEPNEDVRAVLAAMESMNLPEIHELEPEQVRAAMEGRFAGAEPVAEVGAVEDREIPGPGGDIAVRVYTPATAGPHPVVVFYHGGGFVFGNPEGHDNPARLLTNDADAVVVSVDYRLAPEHPFPAPVEDAYAALQWVAENQSELAGNGTIAVAGDSAGGNLAAVAALAARNRNDGPDVAYQALFYPVVDFREDGAGGGSPSHEENAEGYFLTAADMAYFHDHYAPSWVDHCNPYLSPLLARDHADLPPATVVTCGFDPLRDEGRAYADALADDGVPVTHREYDGLVHGVINMVQEPMDVQGGHDVLDDVGGDLHDALHEP